MAVSENDAFSIFLLKRATRRVETLVMTLLIFFLAWTLLAFALAVPVGRLCPAKSSR
jgi:tryptophan-rich sensory protein